MVDMGSGLVERPRYLQALRRGLDVPVIKVLTGVRRCGKSVLLRMFAGLVAQQRAGAQIVQVALDSPQYLGIDSPQALLEAIEAQAPDRGRPAYVFLDEVQILPGWQRAVNAIHGHWHADVYLTGSNSTMLSGELATLLGGRYMQVQVQPFSFSEFYAARSKGATQASVAEVFDDYLRLGGFPILGHLLDGAEQGLGFREDQALMLLGDVFASTLLRDVIDRHQIRDTDLFHRIIRYAQANIGRTFSARSIVKYFKSEGRGASVDTVLDYLQYCQEAFLFDRVGRENLASKELLRVEEKYYLCDHGVRSAAGFNNQADIELVLENIVYRELLSRGYQVNIGRIGSKEIDFVARRGSEIEYFQVCYLLATDTTRAREFGALLDIPDNYPKHVLSMDPVNQSQSGIHHHNLTEWLLT